MSVKRYENDYGDIVEAEDGYLVMYSDYEKLKDLVDTFISCADYYIDSDKILCKDPRKELGEILGYSI